MKYSALNSPITATIFSGLTYVTLVTAMFTSLANIAQADTGAVANNTNYALSAHIIMLDKLPLQATATQRPALEIKNAKVDAEQMFSHIRDQVPLNPKVERQIEEVVTIGRREDVVKPVLQKRRFELINDPETGRSGVVIYPGKRATFALKFNYYDGSVNY